MSITANSRYINSKVITATAPDAFGGGSISVIVAGQQVPYAFNYTSYQVVEGDRIDNLASQFYGDAGHWWRIADGNPEITYWDDLTPGIIIRIPTSR